MYFDASAKNTLNLSQDDVDGLTYLYRRDELGKDKPLGCALVSEVKPPSGPYITAVLVMLLMPIFVSLGLRSKKVFKTAKI